jgi:ABC-type dipeptide/oligopeptide/nickel transport system permease component
VTAFLIRRLAFAVLLVVGVASASFALVHLAPGDFYSDFGPGVDRARIAAERHAAGLDRPFAQQYWSWVADVVRLDFGTSLKFQRPVRELVTERARNTAILSLAALVVATVIGIPLGVFTGSRRGGLLPGIVRAVSVILVAVPPLVGALALTALAARSGLLAPPGAHAASLVVPTVALALPIAAVLERIQSQAMRDALGERFLRAAVARGLPRGLVIWKHAWRVALGPIVGIYGVIAGTLLSGSFIVEVVADWPGLGLLMADALRAQDVFLVSGCAAAVSILLAVAILASDLLHLWVDPRVRHD